MQRIDMMRFSLTIAMGGERNSEGGIQFNSGSAIKKASMKPITPDEFRVMKSYLNVM